MDPSKTEDYYKRQQDFGLLLAKYLSPAKAISSLEFLRGRQEQFDSLRKALFSPGRHALIYGFRGVGKSSLAQTIAYHISNSSSDPILLSCEDGNNFEKIICDLWEAACDKDPAFSEQTVEKNIGIKLPLLEANKRDETLSKKINHFDSMNQVVRLIRHLCKNINGDLIVIIVIIDEFDQLTDKTEQQKFANLIKQISDQGIAAKFIFCGIGESVDAFMDAHASSNRYFHNVHLERLSYEARREIVEVAAENLDIEIDDTTLWRIVRISDGFPHYAHLIAEKLFWQVFEANNGLKVTGELFERAMIDACDAMEMKFKGPYEKATRKYTNDYEPILFAVADDHELQRTSSDIYCSYCRIMEDLGKTPLVRSKYNSRINNLKKPEYANILVGSRQGWYEFNEKVLRGYARLRSERLGVELERDHPKGKRRVA